MHLKVVGNTGALRENQVAAAIRSRAVGNAVDDDADFPPAGCGAPDGGVAAGVVGSERLALVQHALLSPLVEQVGGPGCAASCCAAWARGR